MNKPLAVMVRLELTNDGVKVRCLTAWLHHIVSGMQASTVAEIRTALFNYTPFFIPCQ